MTPRFLAPILGTLVALLCAAPWFMDASPAQAIQQANPVAVHPPLRSAMLASRQQAGAEVLRQIPFGRVIPNKPVPNVPQLVAVPLWRSIGTQPMAAPPSEATIFDELE